MGQPIQLSYNDHLFSIKNHIWFLLMKSNLGLTNPSNFQNTLIHYLPKNVIFVISFWVIQWKDSVFYFCFYFIQCSNKISLSVLSHKYVLQLTKNTLCKYFLLHEYSNWKYTFTQSHTNFWKCRNFIIVEMSRKLMIIK